MDIDIFLKCKKYSDYDILKKILMEFIEDNSFEQVICEKRFINGSDYVEEVVGCRYFFISIESEYTSKELNLDFIQEEYSFGVNVSVFVNIFTDNMLDGIYVLRKIIEKVNDTINTNIVVLDDCSKEVYISSYNTYYVDEIFWSQQKR